MSSGGNSAGPYFYGKYARLIRWIARCFSRRYSCDITPDGTPKIYVCRHLNMHGPYTTLKWLPFHVHPMIINVFFDKKSTVEHMTQYTFSARFGKKPRRFSLAAHIMGMIAPPMMSSLRAVPVYRNDSQSIATFKNSMQYLLKGESIIVFPDINYTDGYDKPSEIYSGFLYLGEMYYKKTGVQLAFVPLIIDDERKCIVNGTPVCITDFRTERDSAAESLKNAVNTHP